MKIAVDAMGGDYAPREIVKGSLEAAKETSWWNLFATALKMQIYTGLVTAHLRGIN